MTQAPNHWFEGIGASPIPNVTRQTNARVRLELSAIQPLDDVERAHLADALSWVDSGEPLFRTAKPATPPKHLVSYFAVVSDRHILLVDHKNAAHSFERRRRDELSRQLHEAPTELHLGRGGGDAISFRPRF